MYSSCFKLNRVYSTLFNSTKFGEFFWRLILKDCIKVQEKEKKIVVLCSRPTQSVKLGHFHVVVVQRRQRNVLKSVMHVQSCLANLSLLFFFAVLVGVTVVVA